MLGALWILTSIGVAVEPLKRSHLLDEQLPVWVRVLLWGVPGMLALAATFWKKLDPDAWGWLIVPMIVRFGSFLVGWVASLAGVESLAYPDGWRGCTSLAIFIVFIRVCAAGLDRAPVQREA